MKTFVYQNFKKIISLILIVCLSFSLIPIIPKKAYADDTDTPIDLEEVQNEVKQDLNNIDTNKKVINNVSFGNKKCDFVGYYSDINDQNYRLLSYENFTDLQGSPVDGIQVNENHKKNEDLQGDLYASGNNTTGENSDSSTNICCDNLISSYYSWYDWGYIGCGFLGYLLAECGSSLITSTSMHIMEAVANPARVYRNVGYQLEGCQAGTVDFFDAALKPEFQINGQSSYNIKGGIDSEGNIYIEDEVVDVTFTGTGTSVKNFFGHVLEIIGKIAYVSVIAYEVYKFMKALVYSPNQKIQINSIGCNDKGVFADLDIDNVFDDGCIVLFNIKGKDGNYSVEKTCTSIWSSCSESFKDINDTVQSIDIIPGNTKFYDTEIVKEKIHKDNGSANELLKELGKEWVRSLNPFSDGDFRGTISYSDFLDYKAKKFEEAYLTYIVNSANIQNYTDRLLSLYLSYEPMPYSLKWKVDNVCDIKNWKQLLTEKFFSETNLLYNKYSDKDFSITENLEDLNKYVSIYNAYNFIPADIESVLKINNELYNEFLYKYNFLKTKFENYLDLSITTYSNLLSTKDLDSIINDSDLINFIVNFPNIYKNLSLNSDLKEKYADFNKLENQLLDSLYQVIDAYAEKADLDSLSYFNNLRYLYCMSIILIKDFNIETFRDKNKNLHKENTYLDKLKNIEADLYNQLITKIEEVDKIDSFDDCEHVLRLNDLFNHMQYFKNEQPGWNMYNKPYAKFTVKDIERGQYRVWWDNEQLEDWWIDGKSAHVFSNTGTWNIENKCKAIYDLGIDNRNKSRDWNAIKRLGNLLSDSANYISNNYRFVHNQERDDYIKATHLINKYKKGISFSFYDQSMYYDTRCFPVSYKCGVIQHEPKACAYLMDDNNCFLRENFPIHLVPVIDSLS